MTEDTLPTSLDEAEYASPCEFEFDFYKSETNPVLSILMNTATSPIKVKYLLELPIYYQIDICFYVPLYFGTKVGQIEYKMHFEMAYRFYLKVNCLFIKILIVSIIQDVKK